MKHWLPLLLLGVALVGGFFIFMSEPAAEPVVVAPPADHAFLRATPVELPYNATKLDYARELLKNERYAESVAVWGDIYRSTQSGATKEEAVAMAAHAFTSMQTAEGRLEAAKLYDLYLTEFPRGAQADAAHYNLGVIAMEDEDNARALVHFTTLLEDHPESTYQPSAAYAARYIAGGLATQDQTLRGRVLARVQPLLPTNATALLSMMTSSVTLLVWLAYDWQNHYKRLMEQKDPVLWGLIVVLVGLAAANYVLEDQRSARSTVDAIKAVGSMKK